MTHNLKKESILQDTFYSLDFNIFNDTNNKLYSVDNNYIEKSYNFILDNIINYKKVSIIYPIWNLYLKMDDNYFSNNIASLYYPAFIIVCIVDDPELNYMFSEYFKKQFNYYFSIYRSNKYRKIGFLLKDRILNNIAFKRILNNNKDYLSLFKEYASKLKKDLLKVYKGDKI